MALTPERIVGLEQQSYVDGRRPVYSKDCWDDEKVTYEPTKYFNKFMFARAIEAEVRKDDEALIRQLVEAAALPSMKTEAMLRQRDEAITAARARLEQPCG